MKEKAWGRVDTKGGKKEKNYLKLYPKTVARYFPRGLGRNLAKEKEED